MAGTPCRKSPRPSNRYMRAPPTHAKCLPAVTRWPRCAKLARKSRSLGRWEAPWGEEGGGLLGGRCAASAFWLPVLFRHLPIQYRCDGRGSELTSALVGARRRLEGDAGNRLIDEQLYCTVAMVSLAVVAAAAAETAVWALTVAVTAAAASLTAKAVSVTAAVAIPRGAVICYPTPPGWRGHKRLERVPPYQVTSRMSGPTRPTARSSKEGGSVHIRV